MNDFKNRLKKKYQHLKKWAKRQSITCYRLYDVDLHDVPCSIEVFDRMIVVWIYTQRLKEEQDYLQFEQDLCSVIQTVCEVDKSDIVIKHRGIQKGLQTQYEKISVKTREMTVIESQMRFNVNLFDYLDTGLFLDHRTTRQICKDMSEGKRVLNLFAYTGSFSVYARAGGAKSTTTVDMNKQYLEWAKRNMYLNFDNRASDRFIEDNVLRFIKNEAKHNRYDLIICDPPTFSNSKKMKSTFSVDEHYQELISDCLKLLSDGGELIFSTNSKKFKWHAEWQLINIKVKEITSQTIPEDFKQSKPHRAWLLKK